VIRGPTERATRAALVAALVVALGPLAVAFLLATPAGAQQKPALPGMTYESLKLLPNWSGWWGLEGPLSVELRSTAPPLKPHLLAQLRAGTADQLATPRDLYCRPSRFVGYSGGFAESVEFLFTPGRVTLANESGLVRRIYTDGRPLPRDADATNTGVSVGHWEGQTLVVETIGVNPKALYPQPITGSFPVGNSVKISERISLRDADTLQFEITMTAPDIFTAPDKRTRVYSRVPKRQASDISFCADHDRAIDPETGKQRFDLTPPADLPPPPPR
jgi:hypothetical protein